MSLFGDFLAGVRTRARASAKRKRLRAAADHARLLILKATEAGKEIAPGDLIMVFKAIAAVEANPEDTTAEVDFYSAYARIAKQTIDVSRRDSDISDQPFEDALDDSEQLLKYAAEVGVDVTSDVAIGIVEARTLLTKDALTDEARLKFYSSYAKLAKNFGDVTAESIRNCSSQKTRKTLSFNRRFALSLTGIVAAASVLTFVSNALSTQIGKDVVQANSLAATLRAELWNGEKAPSGFDQLYLDDPCSLVKSPPRADTPPKKNVENDITQLQELSTLIRDIHSRALKLNGFMLLGFYNIECDPFGPRCHKTDQILERKGDIYLQIEPAIVNYEAAVLCKIRALQHVRSFATNVTSNYTMLFGAMAAYALPICYAVLGAFAYRLRQFADTIRRRTYHPSFADSARLITAAIAGAIAGQFNTAETITLSPLATAFLVGYGVELFFRFLDSLLNAFGTSGQQGASRETATAR